jgi:hypothetical protein
VARVTRPGALVALGALSTVVYVAALPVAARLRLEPLACHVFVFGVAFGLYLGALRVVMRTGEATRVALAVVLGFALVFRGVMLPTPVYLSSDVYRYLWDGRVQRAGVSPYRYPPAAPELAGLRDTEIHPQINRPEAVTVYPPGAQWLFAAVAAVGPPGLLGWRLVLLAAETATVILLLRRLRDLGAPPVSVVAYAWSPLVIYEGVQAGHVDLVVIPLVLLALGWRQAGAPLRAGVTLGLAVLLKLYPAILVLAWWRRRDWRFPVAAGATVVAGYLPYVATLGVGALGFLPRYFGSREDHNIGLRALLTWPFGLTGGIGRAVVMALLFAALAVTLAVIARAGADAPAAMWRGTALAIGAYLLLVPTSLHPWYVLCVVPFLCVHPSPGWLYFSGAVTVSYVKYLVDDPFPWWAWVLEYVPLYALLGVAGYRSVARRLPRAVALRATS